MKITNLRTVCMAAGWRNWLFLELETDAGLVGVGEATLRSREAAVKGALEDLGRQLIGREAESIESTWLVLFRNIAWRGGPVLMTAMSAIDQALWDLAGKSLGVPVYRLFGGENRPLRAYANGWAMDAASPGECVRGAEEVLALGFTALKWDPFGKSGPDLSAEGMRNAVAQVRAVRQFVGPDVDVLIEMHGRFNPATAIRIAGELAPFGCFLIEEPTPPENPEGLMAVARRTSIPVAAGERYYHRFDFAKVLQADSIAIAQPDLCHAGGLTECRKIAALADTWQITIAPHNSSGPVGTSAALHLDASIPNFCIQESFPRDFALWREIADTDTEFRDGYFHLSDKPGLGVALRREGIAKYPYVPKDRSHFPNSVQK